MIKWIKSIIKHLPLDELKSLLGSLLGLIPVEAVIDMLLDWLAEKAQKTDNQLDDGAVALIRIILREAFGINTD